MEAAWRKEDQYRPAGLIVIFGNSSVERDAVGALNCRRFIIKISQAATFAASLPGT